MRALAVVAFSFLLVAPLAARAEDAKLPFSPFEKSKPGDWVLLDGTWQGEGDEVRCATLIRVASVTGDVVTVDERVQLGEKVEKRERTFSTKEAPSWAVFLSLGPGAVGALETKDDEKKIGAKKIACKKVSFVVTTGEKKSAVTAWLAPEVKAGALVALDMETAGMGHYVLACAGTGTGDAADLGAKLSELKLAPGMLEDGAKAALPWNPFAKGKKGDWAALKVTFSSGDQEGESAAEKLSVEKTGEGTLSLGAAILRGEGEPRTRTLDVDTKTPPELLSYLTILIKGDKDAHGAKATDLVVSDDKRKLGDRELDCKKLSFTVTDATSEAKVAMWLSADVRCTNLVRLEAKIKERRGAIDLRMELAGYGDGEKTEWGVTTEELAKELAAAKKKDKKGD